MADMPAKIWITMEDQTASRAGAFRRWHASDLDHGDEYPVYIRADLVEPLVEALQSIRQYGSDTLSGRVDGPDDRQWQRESVLEMTRRARTALQAYEAAQ